jgi:SAM-dependent MidA family methyltransferase
MTWRRAMQVALYAPGGFYARGEPPARHYRTSVQASPRYALALLALLQAVDADLGHPHRLDLVDIGAGRGELLLQILNAAGADPKLTSRIAARAVEIAPRPAGLDRRIRWDRRLPRKITGLVVASEWLDNIPLEVAELTPGGIRLVLVDPATGRERPGPSPRPADLAWLRRWWPLAVVGGRAEIGRPRCAAWAAVVRRLAAGVAVAADYAHARSCRPPCGTLTGYLEGRVVPAVPDGSRDLTAHVALDACAAAGAAVGARATLLTTQREALRALGVRPGRPPLTLADLNPGGYLRALAEASADAELTDPAGLGRFGWLVQSVGVPLPGPLAARAAAGPGAR